MDRTAEANGVDPVEKYRQAQQAADRTAASVEYWRKKCQDEGRLPEDTDSVFYASQLVSDLVDENTDRRPYLIEGLLRVGEIMNIIAAPKVGKSWLGYGLTLSVADDRRWLGFDCHQAPVLIIDNELHPEELAYRLRETAFKMQIDIGTLPLTVATMRGKPTNINFLERMLAKEYRPSDFGLILIDSFYRIIPKGVSENDNASMTQVYNQLNAIAESQQASIAQIHHSSKGDQSQKAITDVGAGAGAMTRAVDTHLTIRPHEDPKLAVFEAVTRSSKQPKAFSAEFEWPLWDATDAEPIKKQRGNVADDKQEAKDADADSTVRQILVESNDWLSRSKICRESPFGPGRVDRALFRLKDELERKEGPNPKNKSDVIDLFRLKKPSQPTP